MIPEILRLTLIRYLEGDDRGKFQGNFIAAVWSNFHRFERISSVATFELINTRFRYLLAGGQSFHLPLRLSACPLDRASPMGNMTHA